MVRQLPTDALYLRVCMANVVSGTLRAIIAKLHVVFITYQLGENAQL
jgi:hypothetical protein